MASRILQDSNHQWANRHDCAGLAAALEILSDRLAAVISLYCRNYDDYNDPNGEDGDDRNEDEDGNYPDPNPDAVTHQGDDDKLHDYLQEIADFADKHGIPFDFDATLEMAKRINSKNRDCWNNSRGTC